MHRKRSASMLLLKSKSGALYLESLPPTDKSFFQNLKQSHLQTAVWRCLLNADLPTVDIHPYRDGKEGEIKHHIFLPIPPDICLIPEAIMKVFRCRCASANSSKLGNCYCNKSPLSCSMFCKQGGISWMNLFNIKNRNKEQREHVVKSNFINILSLKYILLIYIEVGIAVINIVLFKD